MHPACLKEHVCTCKIGSLHRYVNHNITGIEFNFHVILMDTAIIWVEESHVKKKKNLEIGWPGLHCPPFSSSDAKLREDEDESKSELVSESDSRCNLAALSRF
jgi:starvation-inducible outer membrane lipoprotein